MIGDPPLAQSVNSYRRQRKSTANRCARSQGHSSDDSSIPSQSMPIMRQKSMSGPVSTADDVLPKSPSRPMDRLVGIPSGVGKLLSSPRPRPVDWASLLEFDYDINWSISWGAYCRQAGSRENQDGWFSVRMIDESVTKNEGGNRGEERAKTESKSTPRRDQRPPESEVSTPRGDSLAKPENVWGCWENERLQLNALLDASHTSFPKSDNCPMTSSRSDGGVYNSSPVSTPIVVVRTDMGGSPLDSRSIDAGRLSILAGIWQHVRRLGTLGMPPNVRTSSGGGNRYRNIISVRNQPALAEGGIALGGGGLALGMPSSDRTPPGDRMCLYKESSLCRHQPGRTYIPNPNSKLTPNTVGSFCLKDADSHGCSMGRVFSSGCPWVFGVMDGHGVGGKTAAHVASEVLAKTLYNSRLFPAVSMEKGDKARRIVSCLAEGLRVGYQEGHARIRQKNMIANRDFGTTCVTVGVTGRYLTVSNCGDSSAILVMYSTEGSSSRVLKLSECHTLHNKKEQNRIAKDGRGTIVVGDGNVLRLIPSSMEYAEAKYRGLSINMGRSLGHMILSECALSPEPDYAIFDLLNPNNETIRLDAYKKGDITNHSPDDRIIDETHSDSNVGTKSPLLSDETVMTDPPLTDRPCGSPPASKSSQARVRGRSEVTPRRECVSAPRRSNRIQKIESTHCSNSEVVYRTTGGPEADLVWESPSGDSPESGGESYSRVETTTASDGGGNQHGGDSHILPKIVYDLVFIALISDGVSDVLDEEKIGDIIMDHRDEPPCNMAEYLTSTAQTLRKESSMRCDNCTATVVRLSNPTVEAL